MLANKNPALRTRSSKVTAGDAWLRGWKEGFTTKMKARMGGEELGHAKAGGVWQTAVAGQGEDGVTPYLVLKPDQLRTQGQSQQMQAPRAWEQLI